MLENKYERSLLRISFHILAQGLIVLNHRYDALRDLTTRVGPQGPAGPPGPSYPGECCNKSVFNRDLKYDS